MQSSLILKILIPNPDADSMAREDCPSCRPALDPHLGVARSLYCDELRTEYTSITLAAARDLSIPRAAGSLQARLYCDGTTGPVIVFVHGGGLGPRLNRHPTTI